MSYGKSVDVRRRCAAGLAAALIVSSVAAQQPTNGAPAVVIDAAEMARDVNALAADSMRGRATPSRELDLAAQYVASRFRRLGLAPSWFDADSSADWVQRYPIPGHLQLDTAQTAVSFYVLDDSSQKRLASEGELGLSRSATHQTTVSFATGAYLGVAQVSPFYQFIDGPSRETILVAGRPTLKSLERLDLHRRVVLYVPPAGLDSATQRSTIERLHSASLGVVVLATGDSGAFARELATVRARPLRLVEAELQNVLRPHGWVVHVWPPLLREVLTATGVDWSRLRSDTTPVVRRVPPLFVELTLRTAELGPQVPTVPNVIGILRGSDSILSRQAVVFVAHLDGRGGYGANDNAAGVAGLLELAKAFSRPGARPRRSLVFLATSGGATPELWGAHFARVPGLDLVSVVSLDMIGQPNGDSVIVDGLLEVDGIATVSWIAMSHPELGLTVVDGGTAFTSRSDHYAFSRLAVPMFHVHAGTHRADTTEEDRPAGVDIEHAARITQLTYYLGEVLANAQRPPRLNQLGRRAFLTGVDHWE